MAEIEFENAWAGFHQPVKALIFVDRDGTIQSGRLESPPRKELGIVGTPVHRNDSWTPLTLSPDVKLGSAIKAPAELSFVPFSWTAKVVMAAAEGDQWNGTWSRHFPGWDETVTLEGSVHESSRGGYSERCWPTPWLKNQPLSFFSNLPQNQERVCLQLHGFTPPIPEVKGPQNMTLCLDHDGERVVAGVGGAFGYNQSYHEIDCGDLEVTENGIEGSAIIILNPDSWVEGDYQNGGGLAGRVKLNVSFGNRNDSGVYPITGEWTVEWGLTMTRGGDINAALRNR